MTRKPFLLCTTRPKRIQRVYLYIEIHFKNQFNISVPIGRVHTFDQIYTIISATS